MPAPQTATERMQKVQEALRSSIRTTPTMAPAPSSLGDGSAHRPNPNRIQEVCHNGNQMSLIYCDGKSVRIDLIAFRPHFAC